MHQLWKTAVIPHFLIPSRTNPSASLGHRTSKILLISSLHSSLLLPPYSNSLSSCFGPWRRFPKCYSCLSCPTLIHSDHNSQSILLIALGIKWKLLSLASKMLFDLTSCQQVWPQLLSHTPNSQFLNHTCLVSVSYSSPLPVCTGCSLSMKSFYLRSQNVSLCHLGLSLNTTFSKKTCLTSLSKFLPNILFLITLFHFTFSTRDYLICFFSIFIIFSHLFPIRILDLCKQ